MIWSDYHILFVYFIAYKSYSVALDGPTAIDLLIKYSILCFDYQQLRHACPMHHDTHRNSSSQKLVRIRSRRKSLDQQHDPLLQHE